MDVHARSVTIKGIDLHTGESMTKSFGDVPNASQIVEWMEEKFAGPYYAAYETGCTGFYLCRQLRSLGIDCDVIATSSIARSTDDRQRKTDKRDAKRLLQEMCMPIPSYSKVWVPDQNCEAVRDLIRTRFDVVAALKRAKQQSSALLLRYGYVWNEKTATGNIKKMWGVDFLDWINKISLGEKSADEALAFYVRAVRESTAQLKDINRTCYVLAEQPRWKPYVDALTLLKGLDTISALLFASEIGDFSRFRNGRSVSKWLGTVPKEHSSGEHISRGRITKAGNSHCRFALIEGLNNVVCFRATPKTIKGEQIVSAETIALCADANRRCIARYHHLRFSSKIGTNKAKVAIASELVRWIWIVGLHVQEELEAGR